MKRTALSFIILLFVLLDISFAGINEKLSQYVYGDTKQLVTLVEDAARTYQVDPALFQPRADYLLKVQGMSMRDAGIHDGDLLAVHKTGEARAGQVVVARLNDEVTVKRLRRRGAIVELHPENPEFEPIIVDLRRDEFAIEGLGVGVIRAGRSL